MKKSNLLVNLLNDEGGDLIQNVIWIFGGILTGVAAVATLFTTVKGKITSMNTSVSGISTP